MSKSRRPPRKPSATVSINTPQGAEVRALPQERDHLELSISRMFVHSLEQATGRVVSDLSKNEPWPDFIAQEKGVRVGIEVAQIVDDRYIARLSRSQAIAGRAMELVKDMRSTLQGLSLEVACEHEDPEFPPPGTPEAETVAQGLADLIRSIPPPSRWSMGMVLPGLSPIAPGRPMAVLYAHRQADPKADFHVHVRGGYPTNARHMAESVERTLEGKIQKRYASFDGRLMLLLYSLDTLLLLEEETWASAGRAVLERAEHPFAEAWVFIPVTPTGGRPAHLWTSDT